MIIGWLGCWVAGLLGSSPVPPRPSYPATQLPSHPATHIYPATQLPSHPATQCRIRQPEHQHDLEPTTACRGPPTLHRGADAWSEPPGRTLGGHMGARACRARCSRRAGRRRTGWGARTGRATGGGPGGSASHHGRRECGAAARRCRGRATATGWSRRTRGRRSRAGGSRRWSWRPTSLGEQSDHPADRHTSLGGSRVRVVLSNAFGTAPLQVGAAHVALRECADGRAGCTRASETGDRRIRQERDRQRPRGIRRPRWGNRRQRPNRSERAGPR